MAISRSENFKRFNWGMGSSSKKIKRVQIGKENEPCDGGVVLASDDVFSAPATLDCRDRAVSESSGTPMTIRAHREFPDKLSRMLLSVPPAAQTSTFCSENGWAHKLDCCKYEMVDRISCDVVAQIIQGHGLAHLYSRVVIFDCRFPFEFEGGHLPGAINITGDDDIAAVKWLFGADEATTKPELPQLLAKSRPVHSPQCPHLPLRVPQQRGPRLCRMLRDVDRKLNEARYPDLYALPHFCA